MNTPNDFTHKDYNTLLSALTAWLNQAMLNAHMSEACGDEGSLKHWQSEYESALRLFDHARQEQQRVIYLERDREPDEE